MPEGANVEIAHSLTEHHHHEAGAREGWHRGLEVVEVILLALVAIATAWSGFQAAKWDGRQSFDYGTSSRLRFEADAASTAGGQELIADVNLFTAWLAAHEAGNDDLQTLYRKRMTPDYQVAFDAWLRTDPFNNPNAPVGPIAMPEYKNPFVQRAAHLNDEASTIFDEGTEARDTGEKYVRNTVLFAMVLFLVAIAQRFKDRTLRSVVNVIALGVLIFGLASILTLPRIT